MWYHAAFCYLGHSPKPHPQPELEIHGSALISPLIQYNCSSLLPPSLPPSASGDFSIFDALRDTIYTEVATLIATNEGRPHFLVSILLILQTLRKDIYSHLHVCVCLGGVVSGAPAVVY